LILCEVKQKQRGEWHKWFAWYPVRVHDYFATYSLNLDVRGVANKHTKAETLPHGEPDIWMWLEDVWRIHADTFTPQTFHVRCRYPHERDFEAGI